LKVFTLGLKTRVYRPTFSTGKGLEKASPVSQRAELYCMDQKRHLNYNGMNDAETKSWYALYTAHQHEKVLAHILSEKGLEVFLPLYVAMHQWGDRTKKLTLPLFPCYVFVQGGLERRLEIVTTAGFRSIVTVAGRPAVIPQPEIDAVRRLVENCLQVDPHPFLRRGDRVRVKSGPLEGIEGTLVRKKNSCRLVLSVDILQKCVATEVDVSIVERVVAMPRRVA
jgi:transcription antitermination factor NusG